MMSARWRRATGSIVALVLSTALPLAPAGARRAPRCIGFRATIVGTPRDDVLRGTPGHDVIAGRGGDDRIVGGLGNDDLCGGSGDDVLKGGDGIDSFDPGSGRDVVAGGGDRINVVFYFWAPGPVRVDLGRGRSLGWGRDTIRDVNQVEGSRFDDVIVGDAGGNALIGWDGQDRIHGGRGDDSLFGGTGDDRLTGGRGPDYTAYFDTQGPVEVDLAAGVATGDGRDTLFGIENVFGSAGDDVLRGDFRDNDLHGGVSGDDEMLGKGGKDTVYRYYDDATVHGGPGRDRVFYAFPGAIDLVSGTATGLDYSDSLSNVEDVRGGDGAHEIIGDDKRNVLVGGSGRDLIRAGGGDDSVSGGRGDDVLAGGDGVDELDGGGGEDTCLEGETVNACERSVLARAGATISVARLSSGGPSPRRCIIARALMRALVPPAECH